MLTSSAVRKPTASTAHIHADDINTHDGIIARHNAAQLMTRIILIHHKVKPLIFVN